MSTVESTDLTATEIAELLGVKRRTFLAYVYRGHAPAADKTVLGRPLWRHATITTWIAGRKGTPGRPRTAKSPAVPGENDGAPIA